MARSAHRRLRRIFRLDRAPVAILATGLCLGASTACRTVEEAAAAPKGLDRAAFLSADLDGDESLSPEELARHLHREALAEFDLDRDGSISAREWALAKPSAGESDPLFHAIDADGDGRITEDEAVAYLLGLDGFMEAFDKLDADGDGRLQWREIRRAEAEAWRIGLFAGGETP